MPQQRNKESTEGHRGWIGLLHSLRDLSFWFLLGLVVPVFTTVTSSLIAKPTSARSVVTTTYFIGAIALLAIITIGIGTFIRRKNRDVFVLKRRLTEIYLSALKKSALNPQLGTTT